MNKVTFYQYDTKFDEASGDFSTEIKAVEVLNGIVMYGVGGGVLQVNAANGNSSLYNIGNYVRIDIELEEQLNGEEPEDDEAPLEA